MQDFPDPTKIVVIVIVVIVPGADVTVIQIANTMSWWPGDANPALILLTGEVAN